MLFAAIRSAAARDMTLAPSVASKLVDRVARPNQDAITSREPEVLELLASGISNRAIAAQLHVSEAAVKTHPSMCSRNSESRPAPLR